VTLSPECSCPCQARQPPTELTLRELWSLGWRPGIEFRIVSPCGHGRDFIPWPEADWRRWQWVPFYGHVRATVGLRWVTP
jgi:hypothetical protein